MKCHFWSISHDWFLVGNVQEQDTKESKERPWGDDFQNTVYASQVWNMLSAAHSQFESATVIHSKKHTDKFNDASHPYLKTATMNVIAVNSNGDYHLIQIICNLRKHVASLCGFHLVLRIVDEIAENIKQYHLYLKQGYKEKYRFQYAKLFGNPRIFQHSIWTTPLAASTSLICTRTNLRTNNLLSNWNITDP